MKETTVTADAASDEASIEAAKKDPRQFGVLYERYYEQVLRFVYQRVDDKQQAYDATQQVFLKAMVNLKGYKHMGLPFSSWLYRIARNELADLYKKNKATRTVNADTESVQSMAEEILEDNTLSQYQGKLADALSELADEELQLVEMRFFEKRPFAEIGEIMEMTENNAKVKLYRTLDKLKRFITSKA